MVTFPTTPTDGETYSTDKYDYVWNASTNKWMQKQTNPSVVHQYTETSTTVDLDLSQTDSFELFLNGVDTTVTISNPPAESGKVVVKLKAEPVSNGYDLVNASYDNVTANTVADTTSTGIQFKPDGTKMYIVSNNDDIVYQYTLSTAWDLSTAVYDSVSFATTSQDIYPQDLYIQPDGTALYVIGTQNDKVSKYSLPTPWSLIGATFESNAPTNDNFGLSVAFKPDGTKMYILESGASLITQYDLSTPWDLNTAVLEKSNTNIAGNLVFKPDGSKLFLSNGGTITQYSLTTPWEIDTAASDSISFAITGENFTFSSSGDKLYSVGGTTVYQYSTAETLTPTITWPSNVTWENGSAPALPESGKTSVVEIYTTDGGVNYFGIEKTTNASAV